MKFFGKQKAIVSTRFSEFIREAPSGEKKRVYTEVLKKATARQVAVLERSTGKKK
jgi:hypothetical protein